MDILNLTKLFDQFGKLSPEQVSQNFYNALESMISIMQSDVDYVNNKIQDNKPDTDINTDTRNPDATTTESKEIKNDTVSDDIANSYVSVDERMLNDKRFIYSIDTTVHYSNDMLDINEHLSTTLDKYVFLMNTAIMQDKTCKVQVHYIWDVPNDDEVDERKLRECSAYNTVCDFVFYWDPASFAFYGTFGEVNLSNGNVLKYNELDHTFDYVKAYKLPDNIKTWLENDHCGYTVKMDDTTSCTCDECVRNDEDCDKYESCIDCINDELDSELARSEDNDIDSKLEIREDDDLDSKLEIREDDDCEERCDTVNIPTAQFLYNKLNPNSLPSLDQIWDALAEGTDYVLNNDKFISYASRNVSSDGKIHAEFDTISFLLNDVIDSVDDESIDYSTWSRITPEDYVNFLKSRYMFPCAYIVPDENGNECAICKLK